MQRIIKETDTFQLLVKENIDSQDYQFLFMLYQPIVGVNAINLYLTLMHEKHLTDRINLDFNHLRLMLLLNLNQVELLEAFKALEQHQLLVSYYYSSRSTYIYQLKKPLNASRFFADETLATKLTNQIGQLHFERQRYYFLKNQPELTEDFINISDTIAINPTQEAKTNNKVNLQELMINLNQTQATLNQIKPTINPVNKFANLRANLETAPTTVTINHIDNKAIFNQTLAAIEQKTPEEYLITLTKKPLDDKLKNTLKILAFNYQLNNEVINCLIEYVWFKNDHRIVPNYILKIAETLQTKKINNASDALNYLKLAYQKSKPNSFAKQKKYQQDVLWTNDNYDFKLNKSNNSTTDDLMSEKEITKILEEFDKF